MSSTNATPPLTPAVFHILLALSSGERHGYGIMKQVEADSQGKVSMGPGTLYGSLKRLEIARAMALKPKVLLLDEPAAGCNAVETEEIDHLIAEIAGSGVAILLVEHDMKMVMRISNHIVVLDHGEKIAEGDPASVSRNPAVIAAYLGAENAAG